MSELDKIGQCRNTQNLHKEPHHISDNCIGWRPLEVPPSAPAGASEPDGVPGMWMCPTCEFQLTKSFISPDLTKVGVNRNDDCELCPNDGARMIPLSWKRACENQEKFIADLFKRLDSKHKYLENADFIEIIQKHAGEIAGKLPLDRLSKIVEAINEKLAPSPAPSTDRAGERVHTDAEYAELAAAYRDYSAETEEPCEPPEGAWTPVGQALADKPKAELVRIVAWQSEDIAWYVAERNRLIAELAALAAPPADKSASAEGGQ
jgi:hypothetical protein